MTDVIFERIFLKSKEEEEGKKNNFGAFWGQKCVLGTWE
jgi:hypothetical protein